MSASLYGYRPLLDPETAEFEKTGDNAVKDSVINNNGIATLYIPFSDFDASIEELASTQVLVVEFLEPSGELLVFEPRFRA